jgi:hypothetical protein
MTVARVNASKVHTVHAAFGGIKVQIPAVFQLRSSRDLSYPLRAVAEAHTYFVMR